MARRRKIIGVLHSHLPVGTSSAALPIVTRLVDGDGGSSSGLRVLRLDPAGWSACWAKNEEKCVWTRDPLNVVQCLDSVLASPHLVQVGPRAGPFTLSPGRESLPRICSHSTISSVVGVCCVKGSGLQWAQQPGTLSCQLHVIPPAQQLPTFVSTRRAWLGRYNEPTTNGPQLLNRPTGSCKEPRGACATEHHF